MENILEYCTQDLQIADKKVKDGLTKVFLGTNPKTRDEAKSFSLQVRSYFYELYGKNKSGHIQWIGYAVPK